MNWDEYAKSEIDSGKSVEEVAAHIKQQVKTDAVNEGVNDSQAEMFSVNYAENVFKRFAYLEERSKLPKALDDAELEKLEIKPIEFKKDTCNSCEFIKSKDTVLKRCDICHCLLEFKWRIDSSHCPLGKW